MSEELKASTFAVIDLDRTLLNTDKLVHNYGVRLSGQFGSQLMAELNDARLSSEAGGLSFDVYSYLVAEIGRDRVGRFNDDFLARHPAADILNEGAADLLMSLSANHQKYGILTYGSRPWQLFKLTAAQLSQVPYIITDQPRKAAITVASWQRVNGQFAVPAEFRADFGSDDGLYDRILMVDDKLIALEGMPGGAQGLLYVGGTGGVDGTYPDLPESIQIISHLEQVSRYLQPSDIAIRALSTSRKHYASI